MAVVIVDQITKFLTQGKGISIINGFLEISYRQNTGMGFGLMPDQNALIAWLMVIFIGAVLYYYDEIPEKKHIVVFVALLIGGAIGNLIDRASYGFVRDFIAFSFWPAFNVADMAITVGGIGLIIYLWRKKK